MEIKKTRNKYNGNYSIFNARLEDSGTYLCYASNSFGHDSYTTEVIIKPGKLGFFPVMIYICQYILFRIFLFITFKLLFLIVHIVIVDIDVEIKLSNKTFKQELNNKSSPAYKELEEDVYNEV